MLLDRIAIHEILKMYPVGVRLHFLKAYEKWKIESNEQDLRMGCSTNSIASTSSFNKVT